METYEKLIAEHPLLEYIEDPFHDSDLPAYKAFVQKMKDSNPLVKVGVNRLFNADFQAIRETTQFVHLDSDEEEDEREEEKEEKKEEPEALPEVVTTPPEKDNKKDKKNSKGKKEEKEPEPTESVAATPIGKPDPNALKFIPHAIRMKKEVISSMYKLQQIINYSLTLQSNDQFGVILEDHEIESLNGDLVDVAFGAGVCSYLNLGGFG